MIDIQERVLTRGVALEVEEGAPNASDTGGGADAWLRVSIAGVDVLKVEIGVSWRSLIEAEVEGEEKA